MSSPATRQSPPEYSSREPSPAYSSVPGPAEQTLLQSHTSRTPPDGVSIKCVGNITLVLLNQEHGNVEHPTVGRNGQVTGSVLFEHPENVKSVVLTIEGLLEMLPFPGTYSSFPNGTIINTLYSHHQSTPCPHSFSFAHRFPSVLRYNGNPRPYPLPPTCNIMLDTSGHFVKCAYWITVTVVSARHRCASFLTKNERVSVELNYRPRTRPSQPIILNPSLSDTVKQCPEEWRQCSKLVSDPTDSPLICDLFAPSLGVFCALDDIPFYLQLSGPGNSFQHMHQFFMRNPAAPHIRVYILREMEIYTGHRMAKKRRILGEGTLRFMPGSVDDTAPCRTLNWEGEARCQDPLSVVGTFDCGSIVVKDILAVEISPPKRCPLQRAFFGYTIKLTTQRCGEA
ncbi:hypothetical protein DFH07DRAFT_830687 [Mycena maculata]|uniref:Uncharacterized protein n=1 Tax=Mycena maculata TaxID=230809 RepID=A0AAD7IPU8_9AGAR|nr:hypothetical protein DFH07DRAFT_830687 [Mycena maculata]